MLRVNIVGIGPGNPKLLTGAAREAIEQSTILIGDKRMLANFVSGKRTYDTIKTAEICKICSEADADKDVVSVLVSGDVGFFSLAKTISGKLSDCECVRYCGISSLVYFAQLLEMSWDDAKIVSMHGRRQNFIEAVAHSAGRTLLKLLPIIKKCLPLPAAKTARRRCVPSCALTGLGA